MNTDILCQLKELWQDAFQEPMEAIDGFFATGFSEDRCCYLTDGQTVTTALYWFDCRCSGQKLAYIYALATLPPYRGKGLAARLLADTHRRLKSLGYDGAFLKPADGLFPYYEKQGYKTCGYIRRPEVKAAGDPLFLREVSGEEFFRIRQDFLPEGSAEFTSPVIPFLEGFARFWAGDRCVLCAGREEKAVYEFLGDLSVLPGALNALAIPSAAPITPGDDIPFLMYRPLSRQMETPPKYLGLSLE